jgi:hypothetical protein
MTELHPTSGHQGMTEPLPKTRLVIETAERLSIEQTSESAPLLDKFNHRNWDMFVIWSFVVVSFAAFFFCLWAISAKCRNVRETRTNLNALRLLRLRVTRTERPSNTCSSTGQLKRQPQRLATDSPTGQILTGLTQPC